MEIIAEIGQNHNGDMGLARELIRAAADNGAEVAKFQVYDARALFPRDGNPWFDYNCSTELSRAQIELLARECADAKIEFMASVFDVERVDWLEAVGVRRYKVASRSIADTALWNRLAATGKPVLASLGWWKEPQFPQVPAAAVEFLYCISKYPTPLEDLHLASVDFRRYRGFSDHTVGISAAVAAFALGAAIIEKHFTLDKTMYGPDHEGSMTPDELRTLAGMRDDIRLSL
ncbi:MAG: N-acetylneuraminate synthase family protein [Actinomycetota bacterium]